MKKYIVHNPQNFESRYYRVYNLLFEKIIDKLKLKHDVLCTGYYKHANRAHYPVLLLSEESELSTTQILALECEMIIEDVETKNIYALSVSDTLSHVILNLAKNPHTKKVLVAQFNKKTIFEHLHDKEKIKLYSPWIYFPQNNENYEHYYNIRQTNIQNKKLIDKMYFRGTCFEYRDIINYFQKELFYGGAPIGGFEAYANELLQYKIGYSIAGRGEFCYRDVEYMAMGIPFIRFEYTNQMYPKLIPNYHYISVDRPLDLPEDRFATQEHARLLEQKFLEVKDNTEYLDFVAKNAKNYYIDYISLDNCVDHTLKLLEI